MDKRSGKDSRNERNKDLVERMKNGESLTSFNLEQNWFPPRPLIEKNKSAIKKLYEKVKSED